jgi:hypothetical protein
MRSVNDTKRNKIPCQTADPKPYASFSIGALGVCVCLPGAVLDIPLTSFLAIGIGGNVVQGRLSSTCILSPLSTLRGLRGRDNVAIGGRAIDTSCSPRPGSGPGPRTLECPAATGRGWGGRTTAPRGGVDPALPRSPYPSWAGTFRSRGSARQVAGGMGCGRAPHALKRWGHPPFHRRPVARISPRAFVLVALVTDGASRPLELGSLC